VVVYRQPTFNRRGLVADIAELAKLRHELEQQRSEQEKKRRYRARNRRLARKGGRESGRERQARLAPEYADIRADAENMLKKDPDHKHRIASTLARKYKRTPTQIRTIAPFLKKEK
jgi:hypothetical protein